MKDRRIVEELTIEEVEEVYCRMTPTGPVPMTQALTGRTY